MSIRDAIAALDEQVSDPSLGLPDEIFYYISRTTPLVNVDLLVRDEKGRTLLAWRDDQFDGRGWHIPGGIVRFKETLERRLQEVAKSEIGTEVSFNPAPIALNQFINPERDIRGHFISILYACSLPSSFVPQNKDLSIGDRGYLMWHDFCPDNLIKYHDIYRKYITHHDPRRS